ncbi:uncharacterized protein MONOS_14143 [Monocercomonoides exilis]|uniref:uncharacterized protein n=1 Tax=Monocercomonoides exilis TaxID=2049356 RepID=UPI00355A5993|nr:hypothetical protein MONOS_14143 [Monocercomonoides exilis]|eukprot:MONOS_14143.1-p1 / transcript=MONOS_14143.1 / gene=MONOS_14143 / organism=Monocercomonoides_exilis_PA203 / gene_product=unspecified product / transcript_product=unspecified product / location=Mono_scaffold00945:19797-21674(+) / protein_length=625 / sequence_SO=supercontig / SO=protein_coding / is_pseudo=false
MEDAEQEESVQNCSFGKCTNSVDKGSMMQIRQSKEVMIEICVFDGETEIEFINEGIERMKEEGLCKWNGSLVDIENSNVEMRETTIMKSKGGGLYVSGGSVKIEKGEFENNNPSIEGYPSARRNMICEGNSELNVVSVKGGDGMFPNTSLWILNDGCELSGIVAERESSFFIPVLHEVKSSPTSSCATNLTLFGELLLPCDLTLKLCFTNGEVDFIELHEINKEGFSSENEIQTVATSSQLENVREETEVSLCVLFGKEDSPSSTQSFILKNRSETKAKGDERIVEGGKEGKSFWPIIVIILSIILIIFIVLFVVVIMLLRKKLRESEKKVEKEILENEQILEKIERRRRENNGGSFEMNEMPSTLLEGMTSQIPLLIDNDEDLPEPPSMIDDVLNENDLPDLESPLPFPENASVSGVLQPHSFNVISAKKPFREKEKKNLKALHSVIHSVEGDFTLGTRAMDVIDGKEVVKAVADLFEHLISVGDERVEMMGRQLCPYTIFIEEGNENEIYLLTEELEDEKEKEEMKRWKAPEVGNEDEEIEKAVVFTLGLILHEMTTGEVPLSECNAEEAQEMMRDGVRPLTEGIEGTEMVEVMEKMWMDDPRGRPALAEVKRQMKVAMRDDA